MLVYSTEDNYILTGQCRGCRLLWVVLGIFWHLVGDFGYSTFYVILPYLVLPFLRGLVLLL